MTSQRGFTLVELMMTMVMTVAVGGLVYKLIMTTQRVSRSQSATAAMQSNVRAGALIVPNELREIGFDTVPDWDEALYGALPNSDPDLLVISPTQIRFRAMRGFGIVCQYNLDDLAKPLVYVYKPWVGFRDPEVRDSFRLFVEGDENTANDDEWLPITVLEVDPNHECKSQAAFRLTVLPGESPLTKGALPLTTRIKDGGPIRAWEDMEYGLYQSDGWWLGARSVARNELGFQPVLGPLAPNDGIKLTYRNRDDGEVSPTGNMVESRRAVRSIQITIKGRTDQVVTLSGGRQDVGRMDLMTRAALRNTLRP